MTAGGSAPPSPAHTRANSVGPLPSNTGGGASNSPLLSSGSSGNLLEGRGLSADGNGGGAGAGGQTAATLSTPMRRPRRHVIGQKITVGVCAMAKKVTVGAQYKLAGR